VARIISGSTNEESTDSSLMVARLISSRRSEPTPAQHTTFSPSLVPLSLREALIADPRNPLFLTRSDADALQARISLISDGGGTVH
jgi:hypothetical protein